MAQHGRKIVVAHRGASGYLPEHTLPAYAMAHAMGADYLEPDVVLTRDNVPLCLHDRYLETTTDVATRFPERRRSDGHYYALDFVLEEIKTLQAFGRVSEAERAGLPGYAIATLEELLCLVRHLNHKRKQRTGLLIETKDPAFHQREGQPLEPPLLALLAKHGYAAPDCGVLLQSFDRDHLRHLRTEYGVKLPLLYLVSHLPPADELDEIATWADGVNPSRSALEREEACTPDAPAFLRAVRERGLLVFVWTFRDDGAAMQRFLFDYGVDGVITNNPDVGVRAVQEAGCKTAD